MPPFGFLSESKVIPHAHPPWPPPPPPPLIETSASIPFVSEITRSHRRVIARAPSALYDECVLFSARGGQMVCYYAVNDLGRIDKPFVSTS